MTEAQTSEDELRDFVRALFAPDPEEDGPAALAPKTTDQTD